MSAEWFLERIIADQNRKELDELRAKMITIRSFVQAASLALERGSTEAAIELLRQTRDLLQ